MKTLNELLADEAKEIADLKKQNFLNFMRNTKPLSELLSQQE